MANPQTLEVGATDSTIKRKFGPRRGLPNGRALIGALLITVAAVGAFAAAATGPDTEFLVVVSRVEPGEAVELSDVRLVAISLPPEVAKNALHLGRRVAPYL